MLRTGMTVSLNDDVSSSASRISDELNKLSSSADGLNSSLDPGVVDDYMEKLDQVGQKYSNLNQQMGRAQGGGVRPQNNGIGSVAGGFQNVSGMAGAASRGDIGGVATQGASGANKVLDAAGAGGGAMATMAALTAVVGGGNALSQAYEGRMGAAMGITGMMGRYSHDIERNTQEINKAMHDTGAAVRQYGKSYEEGAATIQGYLRAGGSAGAAVGAAGAAARYSSAYNADMMMASNFQGMAARYGGGNQVLDIVNGLMKAQGIGPGQYDELLQGMEQVFTSALSSGITKDIADIAVSSEYFGRMGETYRGGMGASFMQGLDARVAGATQLGRQEDIFLFRAASGLAGGDFVDTMKRLEGGFTGEGGVDLFKGFMGELQAFTGGGETNMIKQMVNTLGVSYTQAEKLFTLFTDEGGALTSESLSQSLGQGVGESLQRGYQRDVETLKSQIAETAGFTAFKGKAGALSGLLDVAEWNQSAQGKVMDTIKDAVIDIRDMASSRAEVRDYERTHQAEFMLMDSLRLANLGGPGQLPSDQLSNDMSEALRKISEDPNLSPAILDPVLNSMMSTSEQRLLTPEDIGRLVEQLQMIVENTGRTANGVEQEDVIEIPTQQYGDQYSGYMRER